MILLADIKDPDQTVYAQAELGICFVHMPEYFFVWRGPVNQNGPIYWTSCYPSIIFYVNFTLHCTSVQENCHIGQSSREYPRIVVIFP